MAQEIEKVFPKAVAKDKYGYRIVNYSMLDLKMQTLEEYKGQRTVYE